MTTLNHNLTTEFCILFWWHNCNFWSNRSWRWWMLCRKEPSTYSPISQIRWNSEQESEVIPRNANYVPLLWTSQPSKRAIETVHEQKDGQQHTSSACVLTVPLPSASILILLTCQFFNQIQCPYILSTTQTPPQHYCTLSVYSQASYWSVCTLFMASLLTKALW